MAAEEKTQHLFTVLANTQILGNPLGSVTKVQETGQAGLFFSCSRSVQSANPNCVYSAGQMSGFFQQQIVKKKTNKQWREKPKILK